MATGHYVRRVEGRRGRSCTARPTRRATRATSCSRPRAEQLGFLRFPLGGLASKAETRALAARYGLPVADKPDSQDICFVPNGSYAAVIERLRPGAAEPGEIVHLDGRVLGRHEGVIRYTVGQRRGLGLGGGEPLYVVRLDAEARRVVVGPRAALATRTVPVAEVNWLGDGPFEAAPDGRLGGGGAGALDPPAAAGAHPPRRAGRARVELLAPEEGVAPGQACVFYAARGQPGARRRLDRAGLIHPTCSCGASVEPLAARAPSGSRAGRRSGRRAR